MISQESFLHLINIQIPNDDLNLRTNYSINKKDANKQIAKHKKDGVIFDFMFNHTPNNKVLHKQKTLLKHNTSLTSSTSDDNVFGGDYQESNTLLTQFFNDKVLKTLKYDVFLVFDAITLRWVLVDKITTINSVTEQEIEDVFPHKQYIYDPITERFYKVYKYIWYLDPIDGIYEGFIYGDNTIPDDYKLSSTDEKHIKSFVSESTVIGFTNVAESLPNKPQINVRRIKCQILEAFMKYRHAIMSLDTHDTTPHYKPQHYLYFMYKGNTNTMQRITYVCNDSVSFSKELSGPPLA